MYSNQQQFESRAVFIQYNTWIHLTTFSSTMYKTVNMIIIIMHRPFMHATAASMHTQTRECAFSLII